jgi:hypothetical protein
MSGIVSKNLGRASGIVGAGDIGADAVDSANIADDAIDSEHYTDGSIDNAHIADDAIDSEHYADGSIDNAHIADDAIDSEHYADGSIDNAHIADDAIDSEHYAAGSIDEAHIADNAVTLAKMAGGTDGNIISFDASGDPVAIATGSDGEVLTSTGAGSPPAFEAAAGGGKLLQVVASTEKTDTFTTTSTSYVDITGITVAITPAATSSKILVLCNVNTGGKNGYPRFMQLLRDSTPISIGASAGSRILSSWGLQGGDREVNGGYLMFLDAPSTTSAVTYKIQQINAPGGAAYCNRGDDDADDNARCRTSSSITVMEIGA